MQSKALTLLDKANARIQAFQSKWRESKKEKEDALNTVIRTGTVGGTAFAFGVLQGRTDGGVEFAGVPVEVFVGAGAWIGGAIGAAGNASHHLTAIGDGAIAALATSLGRGIGKEWRDKKEAEQKPDDKPVTEKALTKGVHMTPEELDRELHGRR